MVDEASANPFFDFRVTSGAVSHRGLVRDDNEDAFHADAAAGLFIVADGMGGHAAGELASRLTVDTVRATLSEQQDELLAYVAEPSIDTRSGVFDAMQRAIDAAHQRVRAEGDRHPEWRGMGATVDVLLFARERAFLLHVGDSRVYLVRPSATIQVTDDHDVRMSLGVKGSIPPRAKTSVPNRLLNAVGVGATVASDRVSFAVASGDRLVLCTDGVHQMVQSEPKMGPRGGTAAHAAQRLIDAAITAGGRDNATAVVVDIGPPIGPRDDGEAAARDLDVALSAPLLAMLSRPHALRILSAVVEVELSERRIPRIVAQDRVAYIVLDGEVSRSDGVALGAGAVLYPESLVEARRPATYTAQGKVRAFRLRSDDFREVCDADARLAAAAYRALARCLAS